MPPFLPVSVEWPAPFAPGHMTAALALLSPRVEGSSVCPDKATPEKAAPLCQGLLGSWGTFRGHAGGVTQGGSEQRASNGRIRCVQMSREHLWALATSVSLPPRPWAQSPLWLSSAPTQTPTPGHHWIDLGR